jgi:XTP/dITP diphosphohydrolase
LHTKEEILQAFSRLLDIQDELREKCPWDHKQTNESLRPHTIEEAFELCDAIMDGNPVEIQKEMGDVMEHLVFYAMIGREQGLFDMGDVLEKEADKLVFRHPHIYGYINEKGEFVKPECTNPDEVSKLWERVKQKEKNGNKTVLSGVPRSLPSLIKAYRIQDKARNVGFDWEKPEDVWKKVYEEIDELKAELEKGDKANSEKELGDVLFAIVNAARLYHINPDTALELTNRKFIARFGYVEQKAKEQGRELKDLTLGEMDQYWEEAKAKGM